MRTRGVVREVRVKVRVLVPGESTYVLLVHPRPMQYLVWPMSFDPKKAYYDARL